MTIQSIEATVGQAIQLGELRSDYADKQLARKIGALMTMTDTTISDRVAAVQEETLRHIPREVIAVFDVEREQQAAGGIPAGVATRGTVMPDGDLIDTSGNATTLAAVTAGRPAAVVFYRGAWCPFCNVALRAYQDVLVPELDARGVVLVAISPQKPDGSLSMAEKNALTYSVVSDPGNQIAGKLGIIMNHGEAARAKQASLGIHIDELNADGTHDLPMPTTVVLDARGTIHWIDVHPDYTTRTEPGPILRAVEDMLQAE